MDDDIYIWGRGGYCMMMWQHLENVYDSGSQDIPNDKCMMFQKSCVSKRSIESAGRPVHFNATETKMLIDMVSELLISYHSLSFSKVSKRMIQSSEKSPKCPFLSQ
jgi:hypothetical protein